MGDTVEDHDDRAAVEAAGSTTFSELLMLSDGVFTSSDHRGEINDYGGGENDVGFVFSNGSRMLCFSGGNQNDDESFFLEPSDSFRDSFSPSLPSCIVNNSSDICTVDKISRPNMKKKRTGLGDGENRDCIRKPGKKCKRNQDKSLVGNSKVRKEKLGERIAALQQLVSPYGKTDAASVLHEAMGYIKFLQDQIQVLCSPYLIQNSLVGEVTGEVKPGKNERDLRSRGLCLVPVSSTLHVDNSNGADLWSPAMSHPPSPLPSQHQ